MYKHCSQAGWVAVRKQFRLIHGLLFDGSSLVTQDVVIILIVSDWRAPAELFQPFSWFLHLLRPIGGVGGAAAEES